MAEGLELVVRVVDDHVLLFGEHAPVAAVEGGFGLLEQVLLEHTRDAQELRVVSTKDIHQRVLACLNRVAADGLLDAVEDVVVEQLLLLDVDVLDLSEDDREVVDQPLTVAQVLELAQDGLLFGLQLHADVQQVVVV